MKTLIISVCCILGLVGVGLAEAPPANADTVGQLSRSAKQELAKSTQELSRLRDDIAAEKLPMAQKLTALEDRLVQLRRRQDDTARQADVSDLDSINVKKEIQARQDELTYIGNLLDEYARTFESKINVIEMQYCGAAVEAAKQAATNNALSKSERFTAQLDFVKFSQTRLFNAIGGMRFPGVGVDQQGTVVNGQYALIGPVALFSNESGSVAGLVLPQTNSSKPLIRPLEGPMQSGLTSLVNGGEGILPFDPSRGAALKALVQKTSLYHIFEKGGPIMWPLLLASILSLGTVLERVIFLMWQRLCRSPRALDRFFKAVTKGDYPEAVRISSKSRFFVVRALGYALKHQEQSLANALIYAQAKELKKFRRGIPVLDTVITLAPLLGLLGTVTGMMGSFSLIGGELSAPGAITGGIAEALIATAFGLGIAITSLIPFNILNTRLDEARLEIESAATQLELLIHPGQPPMAAQTAVQAPDALVTAPGLKAVAAALTAHAQPAKVKE